MPAATAGNDPLPRRLVRREMVHRSLPGNGDWRTGISCGFLSKVRPQEDMVGVTATDYVAIYLLRGSGSYVDTDGSRHAVRAGTFIQRLPGRRHSTLTTLDGQWVEFFLVLPATLFQELGRLGVVNDREPLFSVRVDLALAWKMDQFLRDLRGCSDAQLGPLLVRAQELVMDLHALAREQREETRPYAAAVAAACRLLAAQPGKKGDSLERLAHAAGLSYERFRKVFKEQTGLSPNAYRLRRRVDAARALLHERQYPLKEVAHRLGYPNVFTFSRQFKQWTGHPPGRLRRTSPT